jgi:2'-5' RNA ligase
VRTFVAIDLDEDLKAGLRTLVSGLERLADNVRWVSAAGMHLTLKFLGETPDETAGGIEDALRPLCAKHVSFAMRLKGMGFFPPGRSRPRVIWVGVESEPRLAELQADIESALMKFGYEREKRDFRPHLTVGRTKYPARMDRVLQEIERRRDEFFGEMPVVKVTFFRSVLTPAGAEYSVLGEFPLS